MDKPKYLPESKNTANDKCKNETESIVHEEKNPLNKVAGMIKGGNIELTKAIDMVHQYNLMVHEGKNLDTVVHEETNQLNKPSKLVYVKKESKQKELYSPVCRVKTYSCSYCTMKFSRKDLAEKHMSSKHKYRAKDFCEICRKTISKNYLKKHMLRIHQIEMIDNEKIQMEEHTKIEGES